jgi:putative ABC transport system permease protein
VSTVLNDLRIAIRQHFRRPGFALTVVCTLAITIGATAAVFSVVNAVIVRALPFASPERLVWVASVRPDNPNAPFTLPEFIDYRSQTRTLSGLAAYGNWSASVAGDGETERLQGARVSANIFGVFGLSPVAGRLLNDTDDRADAPRVVVVSHRFWQRHYGGAAEVIGKTARINGEPFAIVGVMPPEFFLPILRDIDVVTPLVPDRDPVRQVRNSVNFLRLIGRVDEATDARQAEAELTTICKSLRSQFPVEYARKEAVRVVALHETVIGDYRRSMLVLMIAVTVVLATALANLLSLVLVRANERRAELSMRLALGASRRRLARQLLVEALLLTVLGSSLAAVVAVQATAVAMRFAPASIPRLTEVRLDNTVAMLDGTVALFVIVVTIVVTLLLTVAPLFAAAGTRAGDALRPVSRGAIGDRWNHRVRNVMVVAQIAAALALLVATIALLQNLRQLQNLKPGFNPDGVFQAHVSIPPTYRTPDDVSRFHDRLAERITASPGVTQTGLISIAPLSGLLRTVPFSVAGQSTAARDRVNANIREITPGYLPTVGTRLLQGRAIAETDRADTPPVALVSAALAETFLAGRVLGQHLMINDNNKGPRPVEIVGVVENVRHAALDLPPAFDIYIPLRQVHPDGLAFLRTNHFWLVKTASDPAAFRATFLAHLRAIDPDAAVSGAGSMRQFLEDSLGPRRFNLGLFGAFALTAVLVAIIGLYGLVSYAVSQRAAEIGVRLALGATERDVQWMVLRQAGTLGVVGAVAGLGFAALARLLISRVFPAASLSAAQDVSIDPATAAVAAACLIGVVVAAAWMPARRASRIEPTLALRAQ